MVLGQLLVTGQVHCCTGEGGATVFLIASSLVVRVATQSTLATDRKLDIWHTWVLPWVGE